MGNSAQCRNGVRPRSLRARRGAFLSCRRSRTVAQISNLLCRSTSSLQHLEEFHRLTESSHACRLEIGETAQRGGAATKETPSLPRTEERVGERRRVGLDRVGLPLSSVLSPLLRQGEREKNALRKLRAACDDSGRYF